MRSNAPKYVVVALLKGSVDGLLTQADNAADGIETHPGFFPNSGPVVQGLRDARKKLADSHGASSGLKKSAKTRSPQERTLRNKVLDTARYVETCANEDPENGSAIIAASTFSEKAKGARTKQALQLKYGGAPSTVLCDAKAAKRGSAFYSWRHSLDNGQTWLDDGQTNHAKTLLTGLPIGKTVLVQVAITQKNVRSDWSASVPFVVR